MNPKSYVENMDMKQLKKLIICFLFFFLEIITYGGVARMVGTFLYGHKVD
jgi:hypothetical protein